MTADERVEIIKFFEETEQNFIEWSRKATTMDEKQAHLKAFQIVNYVKLMWESTFKVNNN